MQDHIPTRPKALLPILFGIAAILGNILPPQLREIWMYFGGAEISKESVWLIGLAGWLLPLVSVVVLGAYAAYLQWFDGRQYDAMFDRWNGLAETNGFLPLADLALRNAPEEIQEIVEVARKKGLFVVSYNDVDLGFGLIKNLNGFCEVDNSPEPDWVRNIPKGFMVHPDLLKTPNK